MMAGSWRIGAHKVAPDHERPGLPVVHPAFMERNGKGRIAKATLIA
jgi:hypothetical protein